MKFRWIYVILTGVIAVCLYPAYLVLWSSNFAAEYGCELHEGFTNPCVVDGVDYAEQLYTAFVSGWFLLVTLPVAALCLLVMGVIAVRDILKAMRTQR